MRRYNISSSIAEVCHWVSLSPSSYYYRPTAGKRGAKSSTHTLKIDGSRVSNEMVIQDIKKALNREFCCYGYHNITSDLRDMCYIINHKKVYRLMDENNLLLGKVIRTSGKREFVKHRKIEATYPMEFICLDIKYIYIHGEKRNYYLLTVLDVFTRKAIEQILQGSIRKADVINIFRRINQQYGIKGVTVRNDNGSQFIANDVKNDLVHEKVHEDDPSSRAGANHINAVLAQTEHESWDNTTAKHKRSVARYALTLLNEAIDNKEKPLSQEEINSWIDKLNNSKLGKGGNTYTYNKETNSVEIVTQLEGVGVKGKKKKD